MKRKELDALQLTPIEDYITEDFGEEGTASRAEFETGVDAFILGERIKEEREKAGMTLQQLAEKAGTPKTDISRVESGQADIRLSTLFKIFQGLGRRVSFSFL